MDQELFVKTINTHAKSWGINPLLLLSGVEGLYTYKDVPLNAINYDLLDSLILTIFSLRIGDQFHALAVQNLENNSAKIRAAADAELAPLLPIDITESGNAYLQSFATVLGGKSTIYRYHIKALDAAALDIQHQQERWGQKSIGIIIMNICKEDKSGYLTALFRQQ
jgi:hypothetical protein